MMSSWFVLGTLAGTMLAGTTPAAESAEHPPARKDIARPTGSPPTLDLREPMALGAKAIPPRLDPHAGFRPWFMLRGRHGLPAEPRHDIWDVGDMTGRYVEALILARRLTGLPIDSRERLLRSYLAGLFDPKDGLCYTQGADWTPRRACLFSQSSAMLGLLAWHRETGSTEARRLLDRHVAGVMRPAVTFDGPYVLVDDVAAGEQIDLQFALKQYETTERAAGVDYRVQWKGSAVTSLEPRGSRCPLYRGRTNLLNARTLLCAPRYP